MGNALMASPIDTSYAGGTAAASAANPWTNIFQDEPGLVAISSAIANLGTCTINVNVLESINIDAMAILGINSGQFLLTLRSYSSAANRTSNTSPVTHFAGKRSYFSNNRTSRYINVFEYFTATSNKFFSLTIVNNSGGTGNVQLWRLLMLKRRQPVDNIEVGVEWGVDDRSARSYTRSGRRIIDPTVIVPTCAGGWPWLSEAEYTSDFLPFIRRHGGTYPALFCLDPDDLINGEMHMIYGDLEKNTAISMEDGELYNYKFAIVSLTD